MKVTINIVTEEEIEDIKQYRLQKDICGWCEKTKLKYTFEEYLQKGNICARCINRLNTIHEKSMEEHKENNQRTKADRLEKLGSLLAHDITEEERLEIVEEMQKLHRQIRHD